MDVGKREETSRIRRGNWAAEEQDTVGRREELQDDNHSSCPVADIESDPCSPSSRASKRMVADKEVCSHVEQACMGKLVAVERMMENCDLLGSWQRLETSPGTITLEQNVGSVAEMVLHSHLNEEVHVDLEVQSA